MKSLVIRAIELLELVQLGSTLMISVCTPFRPFQKRPIFSERMKRTQEKGQREERLRGSQIIKGDKQKPT